ncbi:MAG: phenylacetic acid degradation protein [Acidobacteria bacterium]|nr:MAG: phenylacetic acid degradation protein [Acidobacteriota bacterium]
MTDTQWPRFEVFLIENDGKPAEHVGSVHAPDSEMALLNARDVFVRRPQCRELWVALSAHVLTRTAQELKEGPPSRQSEPRDTGEQPYLVFAKPNHRDPLALWHCLSAASAESALGLALTIGQTSDCTMWAVVPQAKLTRSDSKEVEAFFQPAETKRYKMHSDFPTARQMKEVRQK